LQSTLFQGVNRFELGSVGGSSGSSSARISLSSLTTAAAAAASSEEEPNDVLGFLAMLWSSTHCSAGALTRDLLSFASHTITNSRTGEAAPLSSLWAGQPCILIFLRRLGCALCRTTCAEYTEALPKIQAAGARMVCLCFEALGTGSDKDGSFSAGKFWEGPMYQIDTAVYTSLFGRKGLFNGFFGLADVSSTKLASCTQRAIQGNLNNSMDGLFLGGQFVVSQCGRVVVDHRQKFFGDDLDAEELLEGVADALALDKAAAEAAAAAQPEGVREWGGGGGISGGISGGSVDNGGSGGSSKQH
jgi:hypothetical protein